MAAMRVASTDGARYANIIRIRVTALGREWTIRHATTMGDYIALRQVGIRHLEVLLENSTVNPRGVVYRQREVMYLGYTFRKTTDVRKVWTQEVSNHAV